MISDPVFIRNISEASVLEKESKQKTNQQQWVKTESGIA